MFKAGPLRMRSSLKPFLNVLEHWIYIRAATLSNYIDNIANEKIYLDFGLFFLHFIDKINNQLVKKLISNDLFLTPA